MRTQEIVERVRAAATSMSSGFKLPDDNYALVSREELILAHLEDGRDAVAALLLPAVVDFLREHVEKHGWFYPTSDTTLLQALAAVQKGHVDLDHMYSLSRAGTDFLKSTFRSFWDVDGGPVKAFQRESVLRNVIRYRLGLNSSKPYTYTLSNGEVVSCQEMFDINLHNIRRGFVVQRQTASFFKPSVAFSVYRKWIPEACTGPVVWDPSSGFGARMLGFAAAFPTGEYIGNEPAARTRADLVALGEALVGATTLKSFLVHAEGSEETLVEPDSLDLVFTSPPYFDLEKYYDEPSQCWKRFSTLEEWTGGYLLPTFRTAHRGLKDGRKLVLNVSKGLKSVVVESATRSGFKLTHTHTLNIGKDHFSRKARPAGRPRSEPVLVFSKLP